MPEIGPTLRDNVIRQISVRSRGAVALFAVLVMLSCLALPGPYRTSGTPSISALHDALRLTETLPRDSLRQLLPADVTLPENTVFARSTINAEVNGWFSSELAQLLDKLSRTLPAIGGHAWPADMRVTAALAEGDGRIRVMYSNVAGAYFEPKRIPLASTAKIFVAIGLGEHDTAQTRYCVPNRITTWITADAERSSLCPAGNHSVSASTAFARSMPAPLLWRARRALTERGLRQIFVHLGIIPDGYASLREAAILGQVEASPREMHRAVHAVTLALTGHDEAARTPTVIDTIETRNPVNGGLDHLPVAMPSLAPESYRSVITPTVNSYLRQVLSAPIRTGTLHALSSLKLPEFGIGLLWGKTGTYAARGETRAMWIVGGLEVRDRPYSWLVLINAGNDRHTFGNVNAAAFAPIAKLLIEAAVRDQRALDSTPAEIHAAAGQSG
jgi:membrane peptidoglycan carboxypeptidase